MVNTSNDYTINGNSTTMTTTNLSSNWLQPNTLDNTWTGWTTWPSTYVHHSCHCHDKKIRLTLKEIDVLRRAAKKDAKLRDVLQQLTSMIEVEVEFDG